MPMQWNGWLKIDTLVVPCRSTGLELTPGFKFSDDDIHNKGWEINYAATQNAYEGTVDFPMFSSFFTILKAYALTAPQTTKTVVLTPDGTTGNTYSYPGTGGSVNNKCLVQSWTLRGNQGGVIESSLDLRSTGRTSGSVAAPTFTATTGSDVNLTPLPYWKSSFVGGGVNDFGDPTDATQVVAWDITITNNQFVLYTFDATQNPFDIQPGLQSVTGSVTLYNASGTAIPTDGGTVVITVGTGNTLTLGYVVWTDYKMNVSGPNDKATRVCSYRVMGTASARAVT